MGKVSIRAIVKFLIDWYYRPLLSLCGEIKSAKGNLKKGCISKLPTPCKFIDNMTNLLSLLIISNQIKLYFILLGIRIFWCKFAFIYLYNVIRASHKTIQMENYMFKANNRNTSIRYKVSLKSKWRHQNDPIGIVLVSSLLTLNIFHTFF